MNKPLVYLGIFTTVFGALLLFVIIPAQHIPPMMSSVSPDFYPNIGTVMFLAGGIGILILGGKGKPASVDIGNIASTVKFCSLIVAIFGVTLAAFQWLNFFFGGIILVFATMWLLGERRPLYLSLVSLLSPVLIWLFIDVLLKRSLP